jgi:hypothetical protein
MILERLDRSLRWDVNRLHLLSDAYVHPNWKAAALVLFLVLKEIVVKGGV